MHAARLRRGHSVSSQRPSGPCASPAPPQRPPGNCIIVIEGIYSMLGDTAPLREIAEVKREMGATLIVDEAHSLGIRGENGRGVCEDAGVEGDVDLSSAPQQEPRGNRRVRGLRFARFRSVARRLPPLHVHGLSAAGRRWLGDCCPRPNLERQVSRHAGSRQQPQTVFRTRAGGLRGRPGAKPGRRPSR